jgi:hypothetical protein
VLGWRVRRNEPDFVLLSADSWLGFRGELLFRCQQEPNSAPVSGTEKCTTAPVEK